MVIERGGRYRGGVGDGGKGNAFVLARQQETNRWSRVEDPAWCWLAVVLP